MRSYWSHTHFGGMFPSLSLQTCPRAVLSPMAVPSPQANVAAKSITKSREAWRSDGFAD